MNEAVLGEGITAGGLLREARLANGLHISAVAVSLKVPVSKLEALEADDYGALPDTVFVRALASSVCRTLKIEPDPVLALLPASESPRLSSDTTGINAQIQPSGIRIPFLGLKGLFAPRSTVFVVIALLVAALVVLSLPTGESGGAVTADSAASTSDMPRSEAPTWVAPGPAAIVGTQQIVQLSPQAVSETQSQAAVVPGITVAPQPSTAIASPASMQSSSTDAVDLSAREDLVSLRVRAESWVQIKDGKGSTLLQRMLSAGETVTLSGALPLSVVVGRMDVTDVFIRGQPFDLVPVSRENVARFEVK